MAPKITVNQTILVFRVSMLALIPDTTRLWRTTAVLMASRNWLSMVLSSSVCNLSCSFSGVLSLRAAMARNSATILLISASSSSVSSTLPCVASSPRASRCASSNCFILAMLWSMRSCLFLTLAWFALLPKISSSVYKTYWKAADAQRVMTEPADFVLNWFA